MEKSLKVGDEINGHFVFGHVDGLSKIESIKHLDDSKVLEFNAEKQIIKYLSPKCSIALDGISLTVNNITKSKFSVSIIPYTWENTSLKNIEEGDFLNTEVDMLARYVFKALQKMKSFLSPISEIIDELSKGKMVVVVDDENRENEGDLIFCGSNVSSEKLIRFYGKICWRFNLFST